jgi:hypothetical protein
MPMPLPVVDFGTQIYIFGLKVLFLESNNWLFYFITLPYKGL